ncbi:hypothetical protein DK926_03540 [Rhodococcus sp. Eu-32]|uniref:UGSC family (seleno)protein n=1 Tax=Rhodococcus sp. Eu-32 TaxID=1017319 RepID=UPI000F797CFB|nr:hypothetical protein [Rhodococcus sp. Eu-32]RRQ28986.1 hypothetical protein DK926_03540 [Rhodococcus sp. Eu-32]
MSIVLSPAPTAQQLSKPKCSPVGALYGKRVGLRRDQFWLSWDWISDEWAKALEADGATPVIWRAPVGKGDKEMVEGGQEFAEFLGSIDVAISGLGNCGSCTLWAVHDALGALDTGLPTVAVSTEHFEPLARTLASQRGHDDIRLKVMPYPLEGRDEAEIRQIARDHYDSLLEELGAIR